MEIVESLPFRMRKASGSGAGPRLEPRRFEDFTELSVSDFVPHMTLRRSHDDDHTGRHLSRRTFLRGLGATWRCPSLDAMTPALAAAAGRKAASPIRLAFVYVPNGIIMRTGHPRPTGAPSSSRASSSRSSPSRGHPGPLRPRPQERQRAGRRAGRPCPRRRRVPHRRACREDRGRRHPERHLGRPDRGAPLGAQTRLPSLELGCEESRTVGNCDSGYSCAYTNSISWRTATTPMPPETNPRLVFERLFGPTPASIRRRGPSARAAPEHPRPRRRAQRGAAQRSARPTAASWTSTCTPCARSSGGSSGPRRTTASGAGHREAVRHPGDFRRVR